MKTTKKHFELFKKECQKWIDRFNLDSWEFFIEMKPEDEVESRARCKPQITGRVVTIDFSDEWFGFKKITDQDIRQSAKHEVIHVLIAEVSDLHFQIFRSEDEVARAAESLVNKLEKIIK